ncbi:amino acid adenylation domain-containing protein [Rhodococcus sp. NPDC058521]|uniref:amino acid adenylation domain-containing protein n=1 Tax=Rhodococcus sp. NPDC058521 TaxID=3346536 RepID=UPI00364A97F8
MPLNGLSVQLPTRPLVHLEFEHHAATDPDKTALTCGDVEITYGDLNAEANTMAHRLIGKGIGPGALVGLCIDRTPNLIVSILAVLKAGAAYVPLDTSYPPARIQMMVHQLPRMKLVITTEDDQGPLGSNCPEKLLFFRRDLNGRTTTAELGNPTSAVTPDDLCYVVFTSGSTGTPKAVAVQHRGWYNLLNWLVLEYGLDQGSANLVVSSFGFDITQRSIMTPLFSGAALHLLPSRSFDPAMAYRLIDELRVQTLHCTPSTLYLLVDREAARGSHVLANLKFVFIGGEALTPSRVAAWAMQPHNTCQLLHQYGVSECTDVAASHAMLDYPKYLSGSTPVGQPVYNTTIHILDEHLDEVGPGQVGEVCISGLSLGAGYLNASDDAAKRFTKIVFDCKSVDVYRTGDRGMVTSDGLVIVGRIDAQVKIRGHRIDLGDVDQAVRRSEGVRDAAVVAVPNEANELQLLAYVITNSDFDKRLLREQLLAAVPKAMVPIDFIAVDEFPMSPNNKVDRKALANMPASVSA